MDFWDRNKLKKMGTTNSNSATRYVLLLEIDWCCVIICSYAWSPDGRYFATATTFPRLRVDNGFKVFRYNGSGPVIEQQRDELYEMKWRPAEAGVYPNRPQSPRSQQQTETSPATAQAPEKPQAYRPPRATGNLAAMMRREEGGSRKLDRNAYVPPAQAGARRIPGLAPDPEPSKKSKKKKKEKSADHVALQKATTAALAQAQTPPAPVEMTSEEKQKKLKALNKKLKQIDQLKEKLNSGVELNEDQAAKLSSEESIKLTIAELST